LISGDYISMSQYVGIDIGGNKIAGGIVSDTGQVIARRACATPVKLGGPQILQDSIALAAELIKCTDQKIKGIGIGAGGQIDSENGIVYSSTDVLPGWRGTHITEAFAKELGLVTFVENDVNALAIGEARFGAAAALSNSTIVFLLLDAGVGGALLSNGLVHHGANWSGGEFGQILLTMDANARRGAGGSVGTLEAYCSATGLIQTWQELAGNNNGDKKTVKDIFADAKLNPDGAGAMAIAKTGEYLGYGLLNLVNTLNPHLIIIGGEVACLGDALLDPARQVVKERAISSSASCPVVAAKLGVDAAVVGAASLVMLKTDYLRPQSRTKH
jgi:glucokinase